jgi:hypothetical protein
MLRQNIFALRKIASTLVPGCLRCRERNVLLPYGIGWLYSDDETGILPKVAQLVTGGSPVNFPEKRTTGESPVATKLSRETNHVTHNRPPKICHR